MKFLLGLLLSTVCLAQNTLRTTDFQQSLNANAPRNFMLNGGFEKNEVGVTDASSIAVRQEGAMLEGFAGLSINSSASSQFVYLEAAQIQPGLEGQSCEANFAYSGDASLYKAYVYAGSNRISDQVTLINVGSNSQTASIIFPCWPAISGNAYVAIESTGNGAAIKVDSVYLGKALSIGTVAQAQVIVSANRITSDQAIASGAATQVIFNGENRDTFSEYNATTGLFTSTRARDLLVSAGVYTNNVTSGQNTAVIVYKNGAAANCGTGNRSSSTSEGAVVASCLVPVVVGDTVAIYVDAGTDAAYDVIADSFNYLTISSFPTASETVLRGNVTDLSGSAKSAITASCLWSTTGASLASFAADTDCPTPTLIGNLTAPATKIPAAIAPTLLPGRYQVVVGAFFEAAASTSGSSVCSFEIYDGTSSGGIQAIGQAVNLGVNGFTTLTGIFEYTSSQTNKQFEVRGRRVSGNGLCNLYGSPNDVQITLIPINQSLNKPFIPSSVFAGRSSVVKIGVAALTCATSSTIDSNPDSMISAIGNRSTATCTITFTTGFFSSTPRCVISGDGASATFASSLITSSTSGSVYTYSSAGTGADRSVNLFCIGN